LRHTSKMKKDQDYQKVQKKRVGHFWKADLKKNGKGGKKREERKDAEKNGEKKSANRSK